MPSLIQLVKKKKKNLPLTPHLRVLAVLALIAKVEQVRLSTAPGMQICNPYDRGNRVTITQRFHDGVPDVDGVQDGLVPVSVFVAYGGEDFVQMVHVGVAHIRSVTLGKALNAKSLI